MDETIINKKLRKTGKYLDKSRASPSRRHLARTQKLLDAMLTTFEAGIHEEVRSEQWEKLFGSKDSAVISLQKLVQVIGLLAAQTAEAEHSAAQQPSRLSREEMLMLSAWLQAGDDG